eukprot:2546328-Pyramimonas_sp.AAC.1
MHTNTLRESTTHIHYENTLRKYTPGTVASPRTSPALPLPIARSRCLAAPPGLRKRTTSTTRR